MKKVIFFEKNLKQTGPKSFYQPKYINIAEQGCLSLHNRKGNSPETTMSMHQRES
jgi:hypothetical protein